MNGEILIEEFYKRVEQGEFYGSICKDCNNVTLPPRKICPYCHSLNTEWYKLENEGEIVSYTIIHVPPKNIAEEVPYGVCIVRLKNNLKFLVRIKIKNPNEIKIGDKVRLTVKVIKSNQWPNWPIIYAEKLT